MKLSKVILALLSSYLISFSIFLLLTFNFKMALIVIISCAFYIPFITWFYLNDVIIELKKSNISKVVLNLRLKEIQDLLKKGKN